MHKQQLTSLQTAGALALAAGVLVSAIGCEGPIKRLRARDNAPVDTTLSSLANEKPVALPDDAELMQRDDQRLSEQIQESARQLNVYFANLEMDGVDTANVEQVHQPKANPPNQSATTTEPASNPIELTAQTSRDDLYQPENDDSVRISLLSDGGDDFDLPEPDQPSTEQSADGVQKTGLQENLDPEIPFEPVVSQRAQVDPQTRRDELVRELALILATLASTSDDPGSAALAIASLETLLPEDSESFLDDGMLSDAEQTSLDAARSFLRSLSKEGSIANPTEVASQLEVIQAQLNAWAGLTIKKAALCTRVDGYGWYETFPSYRFIAGVAQPVIVYVELERFAHREFVGPDGQPRYETKLSQRLELYHVADDLNTWNRQAETVTGETRNQLRDYYLTNQITLPANLGVGRYHLKVVMRDLIGKRVAETIIPIEIVSR